MLQHPHGHEKRSWALCVPWLPDSRDRHSQSTGPWGRANAAPGVRGSSGVWPGRHAALCTAETDIWWRHQMETFPRYWPFVRGIHRSPVNSPHKGQWRGALMFSLICARINGRVNNGGTGDLRRHRAHCDVTVMRKFIVMDVCLPFITGNLTIVFISVHIWRNIKLWQYLSSVNVISIARPMFWNFSKSRENNRTEKSGSVTPNLMLLTS